MTPVRLPGLALHLGDETKRGYRTLCGKVFEGEDVEVPMPRFALTQRQIEAYWDKCWSHELVCQRCDASAAKEKAA